MFSLLQYDFVVRAFEAGMIVALIAPLVGIFIVLRRYSLLADTFAHVSLAGLALGLLAGINPMLSALGVTVLSSVGIERLRISRTVYGESALAIFLSGSLALALVLISLAHGFNTNLFNYLFGSIVTVTRENVYTIGILGIVVVVLLITLYKELVFITFDDEAARVSGIQAGLINFIFIILSAFTVSLAIPVVGVLLISALIVVPVIAALQFKKGFRKTIIIAEIISIFSVMAGIFASFYLNLSTGGSIVLIMVAIFILALFRRVLA